MVEEREQRAQNEVNLHEEEEKQSQQGAEEDRDVGCSDESSDKFLIFGNRYKSLVGIWASVRTWNRFRVAAVAATMVAFCLLIGLIIVSTTARESTRICYEDGCIEEGKRLFEVKNESVSPCTDFYQYACGNFDKSGFSGDRMVYTMVDELAEQNRMKLEHLLLKSKSKFPSSAFDKLRKLYGSCLKGANGGTYIKYFKRIVKKLGGWDLFNNFNESQFQFGDRLVKFSEAIQFQNIFSLTYHHRGNLITVDYPEFATSWYSLYYDSLDRKYTEKIRDIMIRIFKEIVKHDNSVHSTICGTKCDPSSIVDQILDIDRKVYQMWNSPFNHVWITQDELYSKISSIHWRRLLRSVLGNTVVNKNARILVNSLEFINSLNDLIESTNATSVNNYLMWFVTKAHLAGINDVLSVYYREYLSYQMREDDSNMPNDVFCYGLVQKHMSLAVRSLLIHEQVGKENLDYAKEFIQGINRSIIDSTSWISQPLRSKVITKISNLHVDFGDFLSIKDIARLDYHYNDLRIGSNFLRNLAAINKFIVNEKRLISTASSTQSNDDDIEWLFQDPTKFTLGYEYISNTLHIPPSTLQIPMFHNDLPFYMNAAAVGSRFMTLLFRALYSSSMRNSSEWDVSSERKLSQYKHCLATNFKGYNFENKQGNANDQDGSSEGDWRESFSLERVTFEHMTFRLLENLTPDRRIVPGEHVKSAMQQLYLTYAQAKCEFVMSTWEKVISPTRYPFEKIINNFVYNSEKFKYAFQCSKSPSLHRASQCSIS